MTKVTVREDDKSYTGGDGLIWFGVVLFAVLLVLCNDGKEKNCDFQFLYNRACQMLNCIKDDKIPFFYYNDLFGVGYGTAFFYGHLILYPFLVFANNGISSFMNVFIVCNVVFMFVSMDFFAKRFTNNHKLIAFLGLTSTFSIEYMLSWGNFSSIFTICVSFLFLSFCVDFFRDAKSFLPACISFFVILNGHLVTALISFILCVLFLFYYFDYNRLKNYISFALTTSLLCSYILVNIAYHKVDLKFRLDEINEGLMKVMLRPSGKSMVHECLDKVLILNSMFLWRLRLKTNWYSLLSPFIFLLLLICYIRTRKFYKFCIKDLIFIIPAIGGVVLGINPIWELFNIDVHLTLIQFPTRYFYYIVLGILIYCIRFLFIAKKLNFCLILYSLFMVCCIFGLKYNTDYKLHDSDNIIVNGEYLDKSFIWSGKTFNTMRSQVTDETGKKYKYHINKDKVIITVPEHTDDLTLTFPKLYYRGYRLTGEDNTSFKVEMGKSQFIKSNIGKYHGKLVLQYVHPAWLVALDFITLFSALILTIYCLLRRYRPNIVSRLDERWSRLWSQIIKSRICRER